MYLLRLNTIFCVLFLIVTSSLSYKILLVPVAQGSHISCLLAIARELGKRQHQTHVLLDDGYKIDDVTATDADKLNITFVRLIEEKEKAAGMTKALIEELVNSMGNVELQYADVLEQSSEWIDSHTKLLLLQNEPLIEKLKSEAYDLAVIDGFYCTKHFYLLAHRLGIPWVTYTDYPDPWMMRVPWLPSFVPGKFSYVFERMSFLSRISNAWYSNLARLSENKIMIPDIIIRKYQQYGAFDSPDELKERSRFWILTSDVIIDSPKPLMPHMTEVGGLTTKPAKKLPEDMKTFLDGAQDGVIVVSFGTMMPSFPEKLFKKFLEAFNRIERHRIIWRLTNVSAEFHIPDFIRTDSWLPQNDILAHPKVKLFITHCGNNGQFEALYHGVPMIGFPFFMDQPYNAIRIESKGFGIAMNMLKFDSDELYTNIMKIFHDPSYKRRISLASEIFRSDPQRPAERAAYWIEHVIKFGSDHLQSAAKDLNFFQFYMLDAMAMCLAVGVLLLVLVKKLVSWTARKMLDVERNLKQKTT